MKRLLIAVLTVTFLMGTLGGMTALSAKPEGGKVVLISLDGARDSFVDQFLAEGVFPSDGALATMAANGVQADFSTTINPSLTAPSHISIDTGAWPSTTGIPANTFHLAGTPITQETDGFAAPIQAEPIWEAAERQGKKVITIAFAGADGTSPERSGDQTLSYGIEDDYSVVKRFRGYFFNYIGAEWNLTGLPVTHYGTPRSAYFYLRDGHSWESPQEYYFDVLLLDTTDDSAENYDTALVDDDKDLSNGWEGDNALLGLGDWVPVDFVSTNTANGKDGIYMGAWCKILQFDTTGYGGSGYPFVFYLGYVSHNVGYPQSFVEEINNNVGFWPHSPDYYNLEGGSIDEQTYMQQLARLPVFIKDAALYAAANYEWDLLMTYQPHPDEAGHQFLLVDPRQAGYDDAAKRARFWGYIEDAYALADSNVKDIMDNLGGDTNYVVISDHGMAPFHTFVQFNRTLRNNGFDVDDTSYDGDPPDVRAITSGGQGHIYINLAGREPGGTVAPEDYDAMVQAIFKLFSDLRDPNTGEEVLFEVMKREATHSAHLFNETSAGDVWVSANLGWYPQDSLSPGAEFEVGTFYGQHGYNPEFEEMHSIFYAVGPGFKNKMAHNVRNIDVAPTIAALLGIDGPADADGRVLSEILR
jgi:predicted AlkP superfamily phosphohydrolase/phosphomutase